MTPTDYRLHTLTICELCLDGEGGECHVPGCAFWMDDAPGPVLAAWLRDHVLRHEEAT